MMLFEREVREIYLFWHTWWVEPPLMFVRPLGEDKKKKVALLWTSPMEIFAYILHLLLLQNLPVVQSFIEYGEGTESILQEDVELISIIRRNEATGFFWYHCKIYLKENVRGDLNVNNIVERWKYCAMFEAMMEPLNLQLLWMMERQRIILLYKLLLVVGVCVVVGYVALEYIVFSIVYLLKTLPMLSFTFTYWIVHKMLSNRGYVP